MIKIKKILKTKAMKVMAVTLILTGMLGMMAFGNFVEIDNTYRLGQTLKDFSGAVVYYDTSIGSRLVLNGSTPFRTLGLYYRVYPVYTSTVIASGSISFANLDSYARYNSSGSATLCLETTYDKYCQYATWGFKGQWYYQFKK